MSAVMVSVAVLIRTDTHAPCILKLCVTPSNGIVRWWLFPEFGADLPLENCTQTVILNNPVFPLDLCTDHPQIFSYYPEINRRSILQPSWIKVFFFT